VLSMLPTAHDRGFDIDVLRGVEVPALLKLVEFAHFAAQERNKRLTDEVGYLTSQLELMQEGCQPQGPRRMPMSEKAGVDSLIEAKPFVSSEVTQDTLQVLPGELHVANRVSQLSRGSQQSGAASSSDGAASGNIKKRIRFDCGIESSAVNNCQSNSSGSSSRFGMFMHRQKTRTRTADSTRRTAWLSEADIMRPSVDRPTCKKFTEEERMMGSFQRAGSCDVSMLSRRQICVYRMRKLLQSRKFEYFMGIIIVLNSLCLGVQSELSLPNKKASEQVTTALEACENVFLSIYVIEAVITIVVRGMACLRDPWFIFDLALVIMGTLYQWCLQFIIDPERGDFLQQVLVLRTLRLLRLLRALRLLPMLRVVWRLSFGLLTSTNAMLSTFALIMLMLYMFGCLGLEIITKNDSIREIPELEELVKNNFASLFGTMITLMQFVTLDSVSSIYGPLVREFPGLLLYFLPVILVVSISLMNMVTAVLVEGALTQANNDRETQKYLAMRKITEARPIFQALFKQLDKDGDQTIELSELARLELADFPPLFRQVFQDFKFESIMELFEILDCDVSGKIMEDEFVDGFLNLSLAEFQQVPSELILILKLSRAMARKNFCVLQQIEGLKHEIKRLHADVTPVEYSKESQERRVQDKEQRPQRPECSEGPQDARGQQRGDSSPDCLS